MADTKPEDPRGADAVVTQAEMDEIAPQDSESKPSAPRNKRRMGPWLFLLLIFIGLPAVWLLAPPDIREHLIQSLNQGNNKPVANRPAPLPASTPLTDTVPAPEAIVAEAPAAVTLTTAPQTPGTGPDTQAETAEPAATEIPAAQSDNGNNSVDLKSEISRLQDELSSMRSEHAQQAAQLKSPPQLIELRAWLSLLASPDTRLAQRAGMWTYLASRPALDATAKDSAARMAALLNQDIEQLDALRKTLKELAGSITEAPPVDLIPKPENPYFAWLAGTFHLRLAPTPAEEQQFGLRRQLLNMEHALGLEDWPEPRAWRQLIDAIHAQAAAINIPELPESLGDIRLDIEASRKAASDWMEAL